MACEIQHSETSRLSDDLSSAPKPEFNITIGTKAVGAFGSVTPTEVERDGREHLPPIRDVPEVVPKLDRDQIIVRHYVGGLVKSFERKGHDRRYHFPLLV